MDCVPRLMARSHLFHRANLFAVVVSSVNVMYIVNICLISICIHNMCMMLKMIPSLILLLLSLIKMIGKKIILNNVLFNDMKKFVIDYLTLLGCECKSDPNGKFIVARCAISDGVYYHLFEVPRSIVEFSCLTSRVFPEFLGLRSRSFSNVGSLTAFLSSRSLVSYNRNTFPPWGTEGGK